MKKEILQISFQLLLALAAVSSCQRFDEPLSAVPGEFRATTEQPSTKTSLGEDWSVLWQDSDSIAVFEGNTALSCYKVTKGAGTPSAIFSVVSSSTQGSPLQSNVAVYPYDDNMTISTDGTVTLTIPSTQKYEAGGFAPGTNIMVAATSDGEGKSLAFRNVLSIVRVNLTGSDVIRRLEFSGNNNEPLCGEATVKPVFGVDPVLSFSSGAGTKLTLDCGKGVQLSSKPTEFFFAVPAMEYSEGFKVVATTASGMSMKMTVSEKTVLRRSKIKTAPATEFKGEFNDGFVHFESPELEAYCIEEFDLDGDGRLSEEEASKVTSIDLDYTDIEFASLEGIEYFENLESLSAQGDYYNERDEQWQQRKQKISGIVDLSRNTKLRIVTLAFQEISELILSPSESIQLINVAFNNFTSLDISRFPALNNLQIQGNQLTQIDCSKNPKLVSLCGWSNSLTKIDVSNCPLLEALSIEYNRLSVIDLSNNVKLQYLYLQGNEFSALDVSMLDMLEYLNCDDNQDLRYIFMSKGQRINDLVLPENVQILTDDFYLNPSSLDVSPGGDILDIEVVSRVGSHFSSAPEWISLSGTRSDGIVAHYVFLAQANETSADRSGQIVLCSENGTCHSVDVTQKKKEERAPLDWKTADFYHRSLMMRFTATWCGYCPWMAEAIETVKGAYPDKLESVSMHASGDLYFQDVSDFANLYGIYNYPTGVLDCRKIIDNKTVIQVTADNIAAAMRETETYYRTVTGISYNSSVDEDRIDVDVTVYAKAAEEFKITVLMLEDNIIAEQSGADPGYVHYDVPRLTLSGSILGDTFTVQAPNSIVPLHFSGNIPYHCKAKDCRLLIFIQRKYGSQTIIRDKGMNEWYVDNCVSGNISGSVPLELVGEDNDPHIGENEDITPGEDIDF